MDLKLSDIQAKSTTNYELGKLQKWLNYELSGMLLWLLSYLYHLTLILALGAAVLFIPLMINVLWKVKRYGWLIAFFILITTPTFMTILLTDSSTWFYTSAFISLGLFYTYCTFLRLMIPSWMDYDIDKLL